MACKPGNLMDGKVFNDHIHGNIMIHPLCVKIIDTPQFQRLRFIKQLGAAEFVYYGATHSRFEHSIGTCYLAGVWFNHLKDTFPDEIKHEIIPQDELCVMIAGLCHDLGHGPLSDMFENFYMKEVSVGTEIPRQELSEKMVRHLIVENNLTDSFKEYGLNEKHIDMIASMINPKNMYGKEFEENKKRMFLYQIVNNRETGVDVDKWDYFARDCLHVNIINSFDYMRLIKFSRVLIHNGTSHICFRDKESENLYKLFELGYDLQRQVYSHKVTHTIHTMLADAFIRADPHLHLNLSKIFEGEFYRRSPSRMTEDMKEFSRLNDIVIWQIASSTNTELEPPRQIILDIQSRKFYPSFRTCPDDREPKNKKTIQDELFKCVMDELKKKGQVLEPTVATQESQTTEATVVTQATQESQTTEATVVTQATQDSQTTEATVVTQATQDSQTTEATQDSQTTQATVVTQATQDPQTTPTTEASQPTLKKRDILVHVIKLDFTKDAKDPIDSIHFYKKRGKTTPIKLQQHMKLRLPPRKFSQYIVTMCWKNYKHAEPKNKVIVDALRKGFMEWCESDGLKMNE